MRSFLRGWLGGWLLGAVLVGCLVGTSAQAASGRSGWRVDMDIDQMDGQVTRTTHVTATEAVKGLFGISVWPELGAVCRDGAPDSFSVMVLWEKGLIVSGGWVSGGWVSGGWVRYRIDDAPVTTEMWLVAPSRKGVVMPGDAKTFAAALADGKTFHFEVETSDGARYMSFKLIGARAAIEKIIAGCRSKN